MSWAEIKKAVNSTLGTWSTKGLNEISDINAYDCYYNTVSAFVATYGNAGGSIYVVPYGVQTISREEIPETAETVIFPSTFVLTASSSLRLNDLLNLKSIVLPEGGGVTGLPTYFFKGCYNLESVVLPKTLQNIADAVFAGCTSLYSLKIRYDGRGGAPRINEYAFSASSFDNIYVPWSEGEVPNAPWAATNATIHYNSK